MAGRWGKRGGSWAEGSEQGAEWGFIRLQGAGLAPGKAPVPGRTGKRLACKETMWSGASHVQAMEQKWQERGTRNRTRAG